MEQSFASSLLIGYSLPRHKWLHGLLPACRRSDQSLVFRFPRPRFWPTFNDVYTLQERIGVQLQQAQLRKRIKVWEAVDLWASLYRRNAIDGERLLEQLGLTDKRNAWFCWRLITL